MYTCMLLPLDAVGSSVFDCRLVQSRVVCTCCNLTQIKIVVPSPANFDFEAIILFRKQQKAGAYFGLTDITVLVSTGSCKLLNSIRALVIHTFTVYSVFREHFRTVGIIAPDSHYCIRSAYYLLLLLLMAYMHIGSTA